MSIVYNNIFKGYGENLLSKRKNKHYFRLLQIFGFRDESLISFLDKDHMKKDYFNAQKEKKLPEFDHLESFQIVQSI